MSKERLEEILRNITYLNRISGMPKEVSTYKGQETVVPVFTKDVEHLIERVQELEGQLDFMFKYAMSMSDKFCDEVESNISFEKQNKRYREAIDRALREGIEIEDCNKAIDQIYGILGIELEESE